MEKIKLALPVIVEGRYDKARLARVVDAEIITTDGFGIFKKKEKLALIKRLGEKGVVVLTDSDGAGGVIRSYLSSVLPPERVYNLYIPKIEGKEKRKKEPSKEGTLGVEGMSEELLYGIFKTFCEKNPVGGGESVRRGGIKKADFCLCEMTGTAVSRKRRDELAEHFSLPAGMTPNALLRALNLICDREEFFSVAEKLWGRLK